MEGQEFASKHRRGPGPWRWSLTILGGLLLALLVAFILLPRLVGGLLGHGSRPAGGAAGEFWQSPTILWDVGETRETPAGEELDEEEATESDEAAPDLIDVVLAPAVDNVAAAPGRQSAGTPGPAAEAAPASEGSGAPGGEGRSSPRILYQEWPAQNLLDELAENGSIFFRLRVEADGAVSSFQLIKAFDCGVCLEEAERIIRSLRFIPGTYAGRPVACWVPYEIEFRSDER